MRLDRHPDVSVVVASFSGVEALARCLESLRCDDPRVELIVASSASPAETAALQEGFPRARFVFEPEAPARGATAAGETRVFRLRSLGAAQARGRIVALLEDHCTVGASWLEALRAAHDAEPCIAGGPVDNGLRKRLRDRALFWCEYAALMPPLPRDTPQYISAVNASYRRSALEACRPAWRQGFYDNEVHDALISTGHRLRLVPEAVVQAHLGLSIRAACMHLHTGGWRYGGYRMRGRSLAERLLRASLLPAVPGVLLARVFRAVATRRPTELPALVMGLPWVLWLFGAWATGELRGVLFGIARHDDGPDDRPTQVARREPSDAI